MTLKQDRKPLASRPRINVPFIPCEPVSMPSHPTRGPISVAPLPRLISQQQLLQMIPYTSQHILRLEKKGRFPRRIQVGSRRVGWLLSEVEAWIAAKVELRARP